MNPVLPRFVVAGSNDAAAFYRAAHGYGMTRQCRVIAYLDGGKKTVAISMDNLPGHGAKYSLMYWYQPVTRGILLVKQGERDAYL